MMLVQFHKNIYVRRHTKYVTAERLLKELHRNNVKLVLNVSTVIDFSFGQPGQRGGIKYCHIPLVDRPYVPESDVRGLVQIVVEEVLRGKSVLIHCNQGCNRSPLIAILAIIKLTGCEPIEAIRRAREIRPGVLRNEAFEVYVREQR
jgi:protein-tyrosine phosphatase